MKLTPLMLLFFSVTCVAEYPDPARVQKNLELLVSGAKRLDQFDAKDRVEMRVQVQKMAVASDWEYFPRVDTPQKPQTRAINSTKPTTPRTASLPRSRSYGYAADGSYELQVSHNDELFMINDEKFSAKLYCFGMEKGDRVKFVEGSPDGVCTSAVLFNLRTTDTCEVWCE